MADPQLSINVHFLFWLLLLSHVLAGQKRSPEETQYCNDYGCLLYHRMPARFADVKTKCEDFNSRPFVIHGEREQETAQYILKREGGEEAWAGATVQLTGDETCMYADTEGNRGNYTCWAKKYVVCYKLKSDAEACPEDFTECFHGCVRHYPGGKTWFQALQTCQQEGFALLGGKELEDHVSECDVLPGGAFWLQSNIHQLTWDDGSREHYTFWDDEEPARNPARDDHCLVLKEMQGMYSWESRRCTDKRPFLCYTEHETTSPYFVPTARTPSPAPSPELPPAPAPSPVDPGSLPGGPDSGPNSGPNEVSPDDNDRPTEQPDDGPRGGGGGSKEENDGQNRPPSGQPEPEPESTEDPESKGILGDLKPFHLVLYTVIPLLCVIIILISVICYMRRQRRDDSDTQKQKQVLRQQSSSYGSNSSSGSRRYILPPGGSGEINAGYESLEAGSPGYVPPPYAELNQKAQGLSESPYSEPSHVYESLPDPLAQRPPQVPPPRAEPSTGVTIPKDGEYSYAIPEVNRQLKPTAGEAPTAEHPGYLEVLPDP